MQGFGHAMMLRAWYVAKPLYLFPTGSIPLTSTNIINLLSQAPDVQAFYAVPFALRLLAESQEGLRLLQRLKVVTFSGSPCPDDLGDFLVSEGIPLVGYYGLSTPFPNRSLCYKANEIMIICSRDRPAHVDRKSVV